MKVLAAIIGIIVLLLLIRVGVTAEYSAEGFTASANIAFFNIKLYPRPPKKGKKKKQKQEETASKDENAEKEQKSKKGGLLPGLSGIIKIAANTLGRFRRKLLVNTIVIDYTAACDDPFDSVMAYARASAAIGAIYPMFTNIFRIKDSKFNTSVDFTLTQPIIYVKLKLSIRIGQIFAIAIMLIYDYLKIMKAEKKKNTLSDDKTDNT